MIPRDSDSSTVTKNKDIAGEQQALALQNLIMRSPHSASSRRRRTVQRSTSQDTGIMDLHRSLQDEIIAGVGAMRQQKQDSTSSCGVRRTKSSSELDSSSIHCCLPSLLVSPKKRPQRKAELEKSTPSPTMETSTTPTSKLMNKLNTSKGSEKETAATKTNNKQRSPSCIDSNTRDRNPKSHAPTSSDHANNESLPNAIVPETKKSRVVVRNNLRQRSITVSLINEPESPLRETKSLATSCTKKTTKRVCSETKTESLATKKKATTPVSPETKTKSLVETKEMAKPIKTKAKSKSLKTSTTSNARGKPKSSVGTATNKQRSSILANKDQKLNQGSEITAFTSNVESSSKAEVSNAKPRDIARNNPRQRSITVSTIAPESPLPGTRRLVKTKPSARTIKSKPEPAVTVLTHVRGMTRTKAPSTLPQPKLSVSNPLSRPRAISPPPRRSSPINGACETPSRRKVSNRVAQMMLRFGG
jgi:hypothetical protein